jgi:hypothetical protein
MRVGDWRTKQNPETVEVSADVDGFRLWYRVPASCGVSATADPFAAAALLPSMIRGETVEVDPDLPVSPQLIENLYELQKIFNCWNPVLKTVSIAASTAPSPLVNEGGYCYFSGGVDSTHTFLKRNDEITHAVLIHGLDFYKTGERYKQAADRNARFVAGFGKTLIPVETNYYEFGYRYHIHRDLSQAGCLGSVALVLGFPVVFVPSSETYDHLSFLGSHPLTDPLWSSESTHIVHDSCETKRTDKLRMIAECEPALANLRVCFEDQNSNCGRCAKCMRTMVSLKLMGITNAPFPPLPEAKVLRRHGAWGNTIMSYVEENLDLPVLSTDPEDEKLRAILRYCKRRNELRKAVRLVDSALFDGRVRRLTVRHKGLPSVDAKPADA